MDRPTPDLIELIDGFLAGYSSAATRAAYRSDLSLWSGHCRRQDLAPLQVRRGDIERYARRLEADGLAAATVNRRLATIVNGHLELPTDGQVISPLADTKAPRWRTTDLPTCVM